MAWKVNALISTRADGKVDCKEFTNFEPGTTVDVFPAWMNTDDLEKHVIDNSDPENPVFAISKIAAPSKEKASTDSTKTVDPPVTKLAGEKTDG